MEGGDNLSLYINILRACKEKGISVAKVERMCDFGNGRIRSWQRYRPTLGAVSLVANALGVTVEQLLRGSETDIAP